MSDINLSVGLQTGDLLGKSKQVIKSLDDIEKAGKNLGTQFDRHSVSLTKLANTFKDSAGFIKGYKTNLNNIIPSLTELQKRLAPLSKSLSATGRGFGIAARNSEKLSTNLVGLIRSAGNLNAAIVPAFENIRKSIGRLNAGLLSINKVAGNFNPLIASLNELNIKITSTGRIATETKIKLNALGAPINLGPIINSLANLIQKMDQSTRSVQKLRADLNSIRMPRLNPRPIQDIQRPLMGAARSARELNPILSDQVGFWRFAGRAAALYGASLATTQLLDTVIAMEALEQSLIAITGSQIEAASTMGFLKDTAEELGFTTISLGKGYKLISAAAKGTILEGDAIDAVFKSIVSSSRALGLSADDTVGSLRA